jgi:glycosyltransferase involved in cell wall biosynthesis
VVATDVDGVRDTLEQGGGLLVPPARPDALAAALDRLLGDPVARAEAGARAREVIAQRHSPELLLARYEELIHEAVPAVRRRNR